jgi:ribosomal protein S7
VGASIEAASTQGLRTALDFAAHQRHLEAVTWLVKEGQADVQARDTDGWMAHHLAASGGHLPVLQFLIREAGVSVDAASTKKRSMALQVAARYGHLETVTWLAKEAQADVQARDRDGWIAHHHSAIDGHLPVLQFLIQEARVSVEAAATQGRQTALHFAAQEGHLETVTWLAKEAQADVLARDMHGRMAHELAAASTMDTVAFASPLCRVDTVASVQSQRQKVVSFIPGGGKKIIMMPMVFRCLMSRCGQDGKGHALTLKKKCRVDT